MDLMDTEHRSEDDISVKNEIAATEEPILPDPWQDVEYGDTQIPVLTQEVIQATQNLTPSDLEREELDIICTLCPTSPAAFEIVQAVGKQSPEHFFRSQGLSRNHRQVIAVYDQERSQPKKPGDGDALQATPEITQAQYVDAPGEIALRLSSNLKDMSAGFVFGRDRRKSDILINATEGRVVRISGSHFRIYINENGMLMLEDMSTNGTLVDNLLLKKKRPIAGNTIRRIISSGTVIELLIDDCTKSCRFMVKIPARSDGDAWKEALQSYLSRVSNAREAKNKDLKNLKAEDGASPTPAPKPAEEDVGQRLIIAGTMQFGHGMRWNGLPKYQCNGKIGAGAFATVYRLVDIRTGETYATKEVEKRRFIKNNVLDMTITREIEILRRCKHPHIISTFGHHETTQDLYILMEYVPCGDLSAHVGGAHKSLSDQDHRRVAKQMCHALAYLHDNRIAHRDIKPENILKKAVNPIWVKLADFGLSKVISPDDHAVYQTFCGTLLYCAPEVYPGFAARRRGEAVTNKSSTDPYSVAVDIWSLSAVMFHLVCGRAPYEASAANRGVHMLEAILTERFPEEKYKKAGVHRDWESFFLNSLSLSPTERWSARKLLTLPIMQNTADVADIPYEFQGASTQFAYEEPSSDEEMADEMASILGDNELDASQLSIKDEAHDSEDEDSSMLDTDEHSGTGNGLGIHGLVASTGVSGAVASRYQLRNRIVPPRPVSASSPRKNRGFAKAPVYMPAVPENSGRLFGEIGAESGVFGTAANTPRIVNGPQPLSAAPIADPQALFNSVSLASSGAMSSTSRSHLHAAASAMTSTGADGQADNVRMDTPEMEAAMVTGVSDSHSISLRAKHHLDDGDGEEDEAVSIKRSRILSPKHLKSSTNLRKDSFHSSGSCRTNAPGRPQTPEPADIVMDGEHETPRARKTGVQSLVFAANPPVSDGQSPVPPKAMTQTFPRTASAAQPGTLAQINASVSVKDSSDMLPPPRRPSNTSSRPGTPKQDRYKSSVVPALGVFQGSRHSISVEPVFITLPRSEWGRAPTNTHVHANVQDTRISKSAFTITLWDAERGRKSMKDPKTDWSKADFFAVISTKSSGSIWVNGTPISRRIEGHLQPLGIVYTGDKVTVFDHRPSGDHLNFYAHFWFGAAKQRRGDNEPFRVFMGNDELDKHIAELVATRSDTTVKA